MESKLTKEQQERVAQQIVRDFGWLGVTLTVAREEVALGKWDDLECGGSVRPA